MTFETVRAWINPAVWLVTAIYGLRLFVDFVVQFVVERVLKIRNGESDDERREPAFSGSITISPVGGKTKSKP
jgi:hypothetical protein